MIVQGLFRNLTSYGVRGKKTGVKAHYWKEDDQKRYNTKVGDIVCFTDNLGMACSGLIIEARGDYGVMGRMSTPLSSYENLTLSVPYHRVPIEMIHALHDKSFNYKEVEVAEAVEMTLEEIEKLVGKRVKIVKGDD